jgi:hypothetical protein
VAKRSGRRRRPGKARTSGRGSRSSQGSATRNAAGTPTAQGAGDGAAAVADAPEKPTTKPRAGSNRARSGRSGRAGPSSRAGRATSRLGEQAALGERPQAPWHPLPLSELLIFVGLIGVLVGISRGESGLLVVAAGILAVCVGTLDFTLREHLSGYRPHTILLAAVPTALLHGAITVAMVALGAPSPSFIVVPLLIDVPVFWVLYRVLRARFRDARRERMFAASR